MKYDMMTIIRAVEKIGGEIDRTPVFLNIVGIRDLSNPNTWNDTCVYFRFNEKGEIEIREILEFTTDPGIDNLQKPVSPQGCAILRRGYHKNLWQIGLHQGKYEALRQATPTHVHRDGNRDAKHDLVGDDFGVFGINFHRASSQKLVPVVGLYSAGCQVVRNINDFSKFMQWANQAKKAGQKFFSYTLLTVEDINSVESIKPE